MYSTKLNIESFTGSMAIGSIGVLGLFLIVNGQTEIYKIFEGYGKSISWGIFAAVPFLVLSYLVGLFLSQLAEILFVNIRGLSCTKTEDQFVEIANSKSEYLIERYLELARQKMLFEGSAMALVLLSLGLLSEARLIIKWECIVYFSAIATFIAAIICPFMAIRISNKIERLLNAVNEVAAEAGVRQSR
jgi:hypothetical protein